MVYDLNTIYVAVRALGFCGVYLTFANLSSSPGPFSLIKRKGARYFKVPPSQPG